MSAELESVRSRTEWEALKLKRITNQEQDSKSVRWMESGLIKSIGVQGFRNTTGSFWSVNDEKLSTNHLKSEVEITSVWGCGC